ncbi:hypothetical protein PF010_g1928 [Phytophthora fragariae]|uniref:Uncharacterized protein n=1 Tax=Phytophthora fragariae TaxID=53985 RepID=A0A6A3MJ45_9STRA|nr:hypothetical protein PF011_g1680 [Phytophthora fragariae]KAE9135794.1 hypothetical protein PF010_g1928 [Phytophthora fragariae]
MDAAGVRTVGKCSGCVVVCLANRWTAARARSCERRCFAKTRSQSRADVRKTALATLMQDCMTGTRMLNTTLGGSRPFPASLTGQQGFRPLDWRRAPHGGGLSDHHSSVLHKSGARLGIGHFGIHSAEPKPSERL